MIPRASLLPVVARHLQPLVKVDRGAFGNRMVGLQVVVAGKCSSSIVVPFLAIAAPGIAVAPCTVVGVVEIAVVAVVVGAGRAKNSTWTSGLVVAGETVASEAVVVACQIRPIG